MLRDESESTPASPSVHEIHEKMSAAATNDAESGRHEDAENMVRV